ncbi:MAG: hypothetical protein A2Y75_01460 [Candidatus Solincola sediminis]|uniref:Uncharacterized protein n=1 Tax=Candidatus Solincola sediminis TaxID=1797199 RepID=A0A1F2WNG7_9ACTN|nr:MAG: hypothetical protein A2Y75_01460 [Candidatus Solincola sediminis]
MDPLSVADKATPLIMKSGAIGVLVLVCCLLVAAVFVLWRANKTEAQAHRESLKEMHRWWEGLLGRNEEVARHFVEEISRFRETLKAVADVSGRVSPEVERRLMELSAQLREVVTVVLSMTGRINRDAQ